jgi:hypothetical protein
MLSLRGLNTRKRGLNGYFRGNVSEKRNGILTEKLKMICDIKKSIDELVADIDTYSGTAAETILGYTDVHGFKGQVTLKVETDECEWIDD